MKLSKPRCAAHALAVLAITLPASSMQSTSRASLGPGYQEGNDDSIEASISGDGRYVAFQTQATNFGVTDLNGTWDVYFRDRETGQFTLISRGFFSNQTANAASVGVVMTSDGSGLVFESDASNLQLGDSNGFRDIFYKDVVSGAFERITVGAGGAQSNGPSYNPATSANGRFVAFETSATNLSPIGVRGVYVRDRQSGVNSLVSVSSSGIPGNDLSYGPELSADGRYVVFSSRATNLVAGDTNGAVDVFVHDRQTATTSRASVTSSGVQGNDDSWAGSISADGRYVAFESDATNLAIWDFNGTRDIFRRDRQLGSTIVISVSTTVIGTANGESHRARISPDGRYLAFDSEASDLIASDSNAASDVFMKDSTTNQVTRISLTNGGAQANSYSWLGSRSCMSVDGRFIAFHGVASNLVAFDGNGSDDVFVRDRKNASTPYEYGLGKTNSHGCVPAMAYTGLPSASAGSGFHLQANNVLNNKLGHVFYGLNGPIAMPFQGGFLYVHAPTHRTPTQSSLGNPPPEDCSGHFDYDFNLHIASGVDPALTAGAFVCAQYWSRDPASASTTNLTNAVQFTIAP